MNLFKRDNNGSKTKTLNVSYNSKRQQSSILDTTPTTIPNLLSKSILIVYRSSDNRTFIRREAAYALGLINTRAIMLEQEDSLVEINLNQINTLQTRRDLEIRYEDILENDNVPEKPAIQVFRDGVNLYISLAAAYSLGFISVENFNNMTDEYYPISDNTLYFLENKYNVTYVDINKRGR